MLHPSSTGAPRRHIHRLARLLAVLLCLGLPAMLVSRPAYAASLVVNSATDAASDGACDTSAGGCTIRDALAVAATTPEADTITFDAGVTAITLTQGTLTISTDVTITGGASLTTLTASVAGQRIVDVTAGPVQLGNLALNGNFTGSGISNSGSGLTMNSVRVNNTAGGQAALGGAVYNTGTMTINGAQFSVNGAGSGGTIANDTGATLTITSADIGASSGGSGGAVLNRGTLTATTCVISGSSTTSGAGGGFLNEGGDATFTNCTFSGNTAGGPDGAPRNGGGIAVTGGTVTLNSVTVGANTAQDNGGGISVTGGTLTMKATLVAGNTGGDISGAITSAGYNLVGSAAGAIISGVTTGNVTNVNARIASLASIPGGSLATHALLPGSPAIDAVPAAECPANDQRGIARAATSGAMGASTPCDIGAFESRGFTVSATGGDQDTLVNTAFEDPIAIQISSAFGEPTGSGVLTFSGPASGASIVPQSGNVIAASNGVAEINFLNANSVAGTYNVSIGGRGIATPATIGLTNNAATGVPGFSSNPSPGSTINVGIATVGSPVSANISVSETGNAALSITGASISGANAADFQVSPTTLTIADGGASQNLAVTCTPSGAGLRTATLSVTHNAAGSPATYTLNCTGSLTPLPGFGSNPAPGSVISLGSAPVGVGVSSNLVISETGAASLEVTAIEVGGASAADFSVSPSSFLIANGGAPRTVTITCTPSSVGARTASLTVSHNASGSPAVYVLTCSAEGVFLPLVGR